MNPPEGQVEKIKTLPIRSSEDVVKARQAVREEAAKLRFSLVDQTKLVTASSELARNTLVYGQGGEVELSLIRRDGREALYILFADQGPGIADIELALKDGYTSGAGMGLGLGGAKRLSDEFAIDSAPGAGTRVAITKWKRG